MSSTDRRAESLGTPAPAIRVHELWKQFDSVAALRGLTLEVPEGALLALFGPNGAGKTTLIRVLSGLARPSRGSFSVLGIDGTKRSVEEIRRRIAVLSHGSFIYPRLTAMENLVFYGRMYGVGDPRARAAELLDSFGLSGRAEQRAGTFSRGMMQRLSLARALMHDPPVLLLDEPFSGLDHHAAGLLRDLLSSLRTSGRTILLTTHKLDEGLDLCDETAIQVDGKIVYRGKPDTDPAAFAKLYVEAVGNSYRWESGYRLERGDRGERGAP